MTEKIIIIGEIEESFTGTPISLFEKAVELSQIKNFKVYTNNPQFLEALEVLCGEENITVYLKQNDSEVEVNVLTAYNYLGDVYDIIDRIRGTRLARSKISLDKVCSEIEEYKKRYDKLTPNH